MRRFLFIMMGLGALIAGGFCQVRGESDPSADRGRNNPEEDCLKKLGPVPEGAAVTANEDGSVSIQVYAEEELDLAFLRGKTVRLKELEIFGNMPILADGKACDLSALAGLKIETAWFYKIPVRDLAALKGSGLKSLSVLGGPVTDLSPLEGLPLTDLSVWQTEVSDLSPLKGMRLRNLNIAVNEFSRIRDLTPLAGMKLETLMFKANDVTRGIDIVRGMKSLRKINDISSEEFWKIYDGQKAVREKAFQSGMVFSTLDVASDGTCALWINGKELNDWSPIKGLPVTTLFVNETTLTDLSPLRELRLESLHIWRSRIEDLSPLGGMKLKRFSICSDQLADLSPLRGMMLVEAGIQCPKVLDLSVLKGMPLKDLDLRKCGVTDLGFIESMPLEFIQFDPGRVTKGRDILRHVKTLKQINREDVEQFFGNDAPARTDPSGK